MKLRLSDLEDRVLRLALIEGLSNPEIAMKLGLSYASIANVVKRARRKTGYSTARAADISLYSHITGRKNDAKKSSRELSRAG